MAIYQGFKPKRQTEQEVINAQSRIIFYQSWTIIILCIVFAYVITNV